jgi:hypothetical protein
MVLDSNKLCLPHPDCIVENANFTVGFQDTIGCSSILNVTKGKNLPETFSLGYNYPNPFNPTTRIMYSIPKRSYVRINIYDITGRRIWNQFIPSLDAGYYSFTWNGTNGSGENIAASTYILEFQAESFRQTRKMVLLK